MTTHNQPAEYESALSLTSLLSLLIAIVLGILGAVLFAPSMIPNVTGSLLGTAPQAFWFLSRGSAFVALGLLWLSMVLGLLITNKMSKLWPGAPAAFAIHEYVSLLGMVFALFHALILMGDRYINYELAQILVPFASTPYRPVWVGIGQAGFYIWAIVNATFYLRKQIGPKTWRAIHYISFLMFVMAILHGVTSGTDTSMPWAQWVYWSLGGSCLFLTFYRILTALAARAAPPAPRGALRPQPAPPREDSPPAN